MYNACILFFHTVSCKPVKGVALISYRMVAKIQCSDFETKNNNNKPDKEKQTNKTKPHKNKTNKHKERMSLPITSLS